MLPASWNGGWKGLTTGGLECIFLMLIGLKTDLFRGSLKAYWFINAFSLPLPLPPVSQVEGLQIGACFGTVQVLCLRVSTDLHVLLDCSEACPLSNGSRISNVRVPYPRKCLACAVSQRLVGMRCLGSLFIRSGVPPYTGYRSVRVSLHFVHCTWVL